MSKVRTATVDLAGVIVDYLNRSKKGEATFEEAFAECQMYKRDVTQEEVLAVCEELRKAAEFFNDPKNFRLPE